MRLDKHEQIETKEFRSRRLEQRAGYQTSPQRAHDLIRSSIRTGLAQEAVLIGEHQLIHAMATSRNAIRRAMKMLAAEGVVRRASGVGTSHISDFWKIDLSRGLPETPVRFRADEVELVTLERQWVPVTPLLRARLECDCERALMVEQLLSVRSMGVALRTMYCPEPLVSGVLLGIDRSGYPAESYGEKLRRVFGVEFGTVDNVIEATLCDERVAEILGQEPGSPILLREMVVRSLEAVPYLLVFTRYNSARTSLADSSEIA
ncbi:MAG: UTRA domain-containing protein [Nocardioidaceae bacterium]